MFSFSNIPPVTKNILILNVLFYIATFILLQKGIDAYGMLGGHYVNSPLFEPYQVITHFFMHSQDFLHILFNMMVLLSLGPHLERVWGPKRFFIFYVACALGAFALYNALGVYEIMNLKKTLTGFGYDVNTLNQLLKAKNIDGINELFSNTSTVGNGGVHAEVIGNYIGKVMTPMVGASGAVFGVMAAFAYLFPNTQLMLLFPPIPMKAKYLVGILFVIEVALSIKTSVNDNIAHLAHVGGAVVGFAIVYFWNKNRSTFY